MASRSWTPWTSEDYCEDARAAQNAEWIIYNYKEDLDSWLEVNAPSTILRSDGFGWIMIGKKNAPHDEDSDESSDTDQDSDGSSDNDQDNDESSHTDHGIAELKQDWEHLNKSGKPITFQSVSELAMKHGDRSLGPDQDSARSSDIKQDSDRSSDTEQDSDGSSDTEQDSDGSSDTEQDSDGSSDTNTFHQDWEDVKNSGEPINFQSISQLVKKHNIVSGGKWMFQVETGYKVDFLWSKLAKEFISGVLTNAARRIYVSSLEPIMYDLNHTILIANSDFTNEESVFKLEKAIRLAGVKTTMRYKPNIYSTLAIYRNNEFHIRPAIYISRYDVFKKVSHITPTF